jgi:uncharacterized RDD family membrane protein YckC
MGKWYFANHGQRNGPLDMAGMQSLFTNGAIDADTLAWHPGMPDWQRIGDIEALSVLSPDLPPPIPASHRAAVSAEVATPPPALPPQDTTPPPPIATIDIATSKSPSDPPMSTRLAAAVVGDTVPGANPWRRFFARIVDMWVLSIVIGLSAGLIGAAYFPGYIEWASKPGSDSILGWLLTPFVLLLEAIIFGLFGSTLGKALLGVRVRTFDGEKPGFGRYLGRMPGVWWSALGTGFPLISLFTCAFAYGRVSKGTPMSYDAGAFDVTVSRMGVLRMLGTIVIVSVLFVAMVIFMKLGAGSFAA